jgi:hypothetical protein
MTPNLLDLLDAEDLEVDAGDLEDKPKIPKPPRSICFECSVDCFERGQVMHRERCEGFKKGKPPKPKPIVKRKAKSKFTDNQCKVIYKMYQTTMSKWKGKSDTWMILLSGFYDDFKVYIEKGRKLLEDEKK